MQVGVVVMRNHRILVSGYNGTPAGMPHCDHTCTCPPQFDLTEAADRMGIHRDGCPADSPCLTAVHAEANAIAYAARYGVTLDGTELYTTHAPCLACAMLIINAGVMRVCYGLPYRDGSGLHLLSAAGIEVEWLIS
jgi:dCMP deaminase